MKKILFILLIINSCTYPEMIRNELVYENDFESLDLSSIDGGDVMTFYNTNVLGDFNNDGFTLFLENLGDHDYVFISFDLYIHGSWDGNFNGFSENDKPDLWVMEFKPDMQLYKDPNSDLLRQLSQIVHAGQIIVLDNPIQISILMKIILKLAHIKQICLKSVRILFLVMKQLYIKLKKDLKALVTA